MRSQRLSSFFKDLSVFENTIENKMLKSKSLKKNIPSPKIYEECTMIIKDLKNRNRCQNLTFKADDLAHTYF